MPHTSLPLSASNDICHLLVGVKTFNSLSTSINITNQSSAL